MDAKTLLREALDAMMAARHAAARVDEQNGDRSKFKEHQLFPCNQAVVHATQASMDNIRIALAGEDVQ